MNNKFLIYFAIPLILFGKEVSASGGIEIQTFSISPSTNSSIQSNQALIESAKNYTPKPQIPRNQPLYFNQNSYDFEIPNIQQNYYSSKFETDRNWEESFPQRRTIIHKPQQNKTQPQNSQPKWWRSESSYEGWKFD